MKAVLRNFRQSPRKVRLVANLIRGKSVPQARATLTFLSKKSSPELKKLLDSAVSNAKSTGTQAEELFIQKIAVDKGVALRRFHAMARGRGAAHRHIASIITLELGKTANAKKVTKTAKKTAAKKKTVKKAE